MLFLLIYSHFGAELYYEMYFLMDIVDNFEIMTLISHNKWQSISLMKIFYFFYLFNRAPKNWFSVMCKRAHAERAGAWGGVADISTLFCFYEMRTHKTY